MKYFTEISQTLIANARLVKKDTYLFCFQNYLKMNHFNLDLNSVILNCDTEDSKLYRIYHGLSSTFKDPLLEAGICSLIHQVVKFFTKFLKGGM